MNIYLQGLTMGLAYVAPIGLQNLFVINSALTQKRSRVYITALIVIFWDISLGVSCFLGAGALMQALPWLQKVILCVGSLIVLWIGIGLLRSKASLEGGRDVNVPLWKLASTAFVVTWLNPQAIIDGLASGEVEKANVDQAAARILRFKYNKGLFENPYCDVKAAVELCASAEWAANPTAITSDEELRAARNPYEVELTERLQAKSAVLVKNDDNLLPLSKDAKIYIDGSNSTAKEGYKKYMTELGVTLVDNMEDADVVVGDYASINDATELFIEDAQDLEKPIVLTLNTTKPTQYAIESANALLYLSYSQGADHGSTEGGFVTTTAPWVYVNLLYGIVEPDGVINKEIARDVVADNEQWKDLAGDQGASPYVRLMVQATMEDDPNHASPRNWGDPLVSYHYGMHYGQNPEFKYSCLILPMMQETKEVESGSSTSTQTTVWNQAKAGEPFTVYALLRNTGSDGITTVQAKANGEVMAEKIMTVPGGSWRVVQMDITLDAGEYTIEIGGQTGTITIE